MLNTNTTFSRYTFEYRISGFRSNATETGASTNGTSDTGVDAEILDIETAAADPVRLGGGFTSFVTVFDLPAEMRNTIYGYALREDAKVLPGTGKEPALFMTCHKVREEAQQMFYAINDLEFSIWPSQIFQPQNPVYRWAYYMIGQNALQVGQDLSTRSTCSDLELEQREFRGRTGLALESVHHKFRQTLAFNDPRVWMMESPEHATTIPHALKFIYKNLEQDDMAEWLAHNVVRGIVQYMHLQGWKKANLTALDCITGRWSESLGGEYEVFHKKS